MLNGDEEHPCDGYCTTSYTVDWRWRAQRNPDFNELDNSNSTSETVQSLCKTWHSALTSIEIYYTNADDIGVNLQLVKIKHMANYR